MPGTASFTGPCFTVPNGTNLPGSTTEQIAAPHYGYLRLALSGGKGDWDLAAFSHGRVVTAAASAGPDEVATGYALANEQITVRVCRNPGATGTPQLVASYDSLPDPGGAQRVELLRVQTPGAADRSRLAASGLDVTENAGPGYTDVVSYGPGDKRTLARAGLPYSVLDRKPGAGAASLEADADPRATAARAGGLPSGRTSYRRLFNYEQEMKDLAAAHPGQVKLITLPERTGEGRAIEGLVVGNDPGADDGRPIELSIGVHHAREWPSGELTLEWAYELLGGSPHANGLLADEKNIVVPIASPDGFNLSREAGQLPVDWGVRSGNPGATIPQLQAEFHRANCRMQRSGYVADCGRVDPPYPAAGVDNNRNYGGQWGGYGASPEWGNETFRGPAPFSEPETRDIASLFRTEQITSALTSHTYAALIIRPPDVRSQPTTVDEGLYGKLGGELGHDTGWPSVLGWKLYDTSGVMEDYSYYTAGSLSFTPEFGTEDFHSAYPGVANQWTGATPKADGGMRAAFYDIADSAASPASHVTVTGTGPPGGSIEFEKRFRTRTAAVLTSKGATKPIRFADSLHSSVDVGDDGRFTAAVNPSTRPIVAQRKAPPRRENWKVVCRDSAGRVTGSRNLFAERGDAVRLNLSSGC